jgi:rhodanese-related sulfurtransferase
MHSSPITSSAHSPVTVVSSARALLPWLTVLLMLLLASQAYTAVASRASAGQQWLGIALVTMASIGLSVVIVMQRARLAALSQLHLACLMVAFALLPRMAALFAQPILDDDYFRFLWDGYQSLQGVSPYANAPAASFGKESLSPAWQHVLSNINHPDVKTIYGPALQLIFAAAVALTEANPLGYRLIVCCADLGLIALLWRSCVAPWLVLLYSINALVLKELHYSLHPDGMIALALVVAVTSAANRHARWGPAAALATAIAMKPPLAILTVAFIRAPLRETLAQLVRIALICAALYLPFFLVGQQSSLGLEGLQSFATEWRVNALGYRLIEWLGGAWNGLANDSWVNTFARSTYTALVILAALACLGLRMNWLAPRAAAQTPSSATLIAALLAFALLFAPTVNAWYWTILLPVALLVGQGRARHDVAIAATAMSFVLLLSYWNGSTERALWGASGLARHQVHGMATWLEAGIAILLALWLARMSREAEVAMRWLLPIWALMTALALVFTASLPLRETVMHQVIQLRFNHVKHIELADLRTRLQQGEPTLLIDARAMDEFRTSHLPHAQWHRALTATVAEIASFATEHPQGLIVVYCSVGYRSSALAAALTQALPAQSNTQPIALHNLRGGMFAWVNEGYALVNQRGTTTQVHPYSSAWSQWLLPQHRSSTTP